MFNFLIQHKKNRKIITHKKNETFRNRFFEVLVNELENSYIKDIETRKTQISFKAPVARFAWNGWNLFNPVTEGTVRITLRGNIPKLTYELRFLEFFVIAAAMSLSSIPAFALGLAWLGLVVLAVTWLGFYLGSRLITASRFSSFIDDTIAKINYPDAERFNFMDYIEDDINFAKTVFLERNETISVG